MSVIAVFSGPFCAGEAISARLADRLGYGLVTNDVLLEQAVRSHDTTVDKLERTLSGERGLLSSVTHDLEKGLIYLKAAVAEAVSGQDVVLHGPAIHLIPRSISHVLRVCVVATEDFRLERAAEAGLSPVDAGKHLEQADARLTSWTRHLCSGAGPWDAELYDVKVPLPTKSIDEAVELLVEARAADSLRPTDLSINATLDFVLAAQINLQLLDQGYYYCDVSVQGGHVTVTVNKPPQPGAIARVIHGLRLDKLERELTELALGNDGVTDVEIRPGAGLQRPRSGPPRALLVDDEEEYVVTLSERLEMREIETAVVHDGAQALSFVDNDEPEVMVLDLRMPGIDGLEVLARVKRDHPDIEVIVVTGHGSAKDERAARQLGAFDYLEKPVDINRLAERMKAASRKARGELTDDID